MNAFETLSVVRVPFPFSDRLAQKRRPAVVLSASDFQRESGHCLLAMITSAKQSSWPLDWPIQQWSTAGLSQPCTVRFKLFSLDERLILGALGQLASVDAAGVQVHLQRLLKLNP